MNRLNNRITRIFIVALTLSIIAPIAIPGIVLCAIFKLWVLFGICSAIVFISFYAIPLLWVKYADLKSKRKILKMILDKHIYEIKELAIAFNITKKDMALRVNYLLQWGYLEGYVLENDSFIRKLNRKYLLVKCPSCGASIEINNEDKYICKYCNTIYHED